MNYTAEEGMRTMISSFRSNELQSLLGAFSRNKAGRKSELKDRALELLRNKPVGFNYQAYCAKIVELYRSMQNNADVPNSNDMYRNINMMHGHRQMVSMNIPSQQQRLYQPPQYPQQPMQMTRAALPQVMPQMQRSIYGGNSNIPGNNNLQYNYQQTVPRTIMPINQPLGMAVPDQMGGYDTNTAHMNNNFVPTPPLTNVKFKKLPFYEVIDEIIKPTVLIGQDKCSLTNLARGKYTYVIYCYVSIE